MKTFALIVIIVLELFVRAATAQAFPELIRHGYQSCGACHHSSSGGGVLNAYGRPTGRNIVPMLRGSTLDLPKWIDVGGNYRMLNLNVRAPDGTRFHQKIPMEQEGEIALNPIDGLSFVGSLGVYGPQGIQEYRRMYAQLTVGDYVAFRAGKFLASFGINDADHSLSTRRLLGGQGSETWNSEAVVTTPYGELAYTYSVGQRAIFEATDGKGVAVAPDETRRHFVRAAAYLPGNNQVGIQARTNDTRLDVYGGFMFASYKTWLYLIGEIDRTVDVNGSGNNIAYTKLGVEPVRGLHVFSTYEFHDETHVPGIGLQWFPINGVDLLARGRRGISNEGNSDELSLVLHTYL